MHVHDFPYISRVRIENYRSIKKLDVELPRTAVLVGPNGSGKTNFVQAIGLLGCILAESSTAPVEELGWESVARQTDAHAGYIRLGMDVTTVFGESRERGLAERPAILSVDVELRADNGGVSVIEERFALSAPEGQFSVILKGQSLTVEGNGEPGLALLAFPSRLLLGNSLDSERSASLEDVRHGLNQLLIETETRHHARKASQSENSAYLRLLGLHRLYRGILGLVVSRSQVTRLRLDASSLRDSSSYTTPLSSTGAGLPSAVNALRGAGELASAAHQNMLVGLRSVFPKLKEVQAVRTRSGRLELTFAEEGVKDPFGQDAVSDGLLHALALLVALESPVPQDRDAGHAGPLVIEELENAIHPWAIQVLMGRVQDTTSQHRQVILTTHSVEVVNAITDPASLLVCEVGEEGTTITPATDKEEALAAIMRESGERLGEIWVSGGIGGVP